MDKASLRSEFNLLHVTSTAIIQASGNFRLRFIVDDLGKFVEGYWIISAVNSCVQISRQFVIKCDLHIVYLEFSLITALTKLETELQL